MKPTVYIETSVISYLTFVHRKNLWRLNMRKDLIVEQVRAIRKQIEQQYPDAESFYKHQEQQQAYRASLTRRKPEKAPRAKAS
jgi:hypothetical protein